MSLIYHSYHRTLQTLDTIFPCSLLRIISRAREPSNHFFYMVYSHISDHAPFYICIYTRKLYIKLFRVHITYSEHTETQNPLSKREGKERVNRKTRKEKKCLRLQASSTSSSKRKPEETQENKKKKKRRRQLFLLLLLLLPAPLSPRHSHSLSPRERAQNIRRRERRGRGFGLWRGAAAKPPRRNRGELSSSSSSLLLPAAAAPCKADAVHFVGVERRGRVRRQSGGGGRYEQLLLLSWVEGFGGFTPPPISRFRVGDSAPPPVIGSRRRPSRRG